MLPGHYPTALGRCSAAGKGHRPSLRRHRLLGRRDEMNRATAIAGAVYFRIGATVIEVATGKETTYKGDHVLSKPTVTKHLNKAGMEVSETKYKRSVLTDYPSISAAKRACRMKGVVAQQPGEDLRKVAARIREMVEAK